jgi:hypothetical protein
MGEQFDELASAVAGGAPFSDKGQEGLRHRRSRKRRRGIRDSTYSIAFGYPPGKKAAQTRIDAFV